MSRTGKCIKMLCILGDGEMFHTDVLAKMLDTNQRNIRKFRKELEEVGFEFICKTGVYGGIQLVNRKIEICEI